jgi:antitoxin HicB
VKRANKGSSFDDWLKQEGIYEEATAAAVKRVLARQIERAMEERQLTKAEVARRMHTSRAAVDRLLDPQNGSVTLNTLYWAAAAVGRQVRLELV